MKKLLIPVLFFAVLLPASLRAQDKDDKLDLPGDNLNLYAVLKLFQESATLEGFEQKLNEENNEINNLDLNGDDQTDYIKVIDDVDGDVHTIVLQTDISATEKQDIAVFTVQKDAEGKVQVQLIGDEALYGKDYIIEPNADDNTGGTPNPGYTGNQTEVDGQPVVIEKTTTVIIGSWPMVRYIYMPSYTIWHSPWYWNHYPGYWHPWRPVYWHAYQGYHSNWDYYYYGHYRRWPVYRYNRWNDFYKPRRAQSVVVITRRQNGLYRNTYAKPQTRSEGIALYNKRNPGVRPGIQRPVTRPGVVKPTRPVAERPVTRPVQPGVTRPVTRPITRPVTRPVTRPDVQKPVVRRAQPDIKPVTRPARAGGGMQRPAVRPAQPQTQPVQKNKRGG